MFVRVRFSVRAMMPGCWLGYCHDETAVLHALQADQATCELLYMPRFPVDDEDFEA